MRFIVFIIVINFLISPSYASDPNTYIIKHRSGMPSRAILDKKFIHIQSPSMQMINPGATDSSGLKNLANQPLAIKSSSPKITQTKTFSKKNTKSIDNSKWDDYAVESDNEDYEELNVNAVLMN